MKDFLIHKKREAENKLKGLSEYDNEYSYFLGMVAAFEEVIEEIKK